MDRGVEGLKKPGFKERRTDSQERSRESMGLLREKGTDLFWMVLKSQCTCILRINSLFLEISNSCEFL